MLEERHIDLKALKDRLNANGNLGFASVGYLHDLLGDEAGAVTPLAVINDKAGVVKTCAWDPTRKSGRTRLAVPLF